MRRRCDVAAALRWYYSDADWRDSEQHPGCYWRKHPDRLLTANGDILLGSAKVLGFGAPQALSGAGACNVTTVATLFTSTGSAQALTLADGTRADSSSLSVMLWTVDRVFLTPTTKTGFSTVTFTNVNDWACLIWSGSAWFVLAYSGATIA